MPKSQRNVGSIAIPTLIQESQIQGSVPVMQISELRSNSRCLCLFYSTGDWIQGYHMSHTPKHFVFILFLS
jgi:hypothetical protein